MNKLSLIFLLFAVLVTFGADFNPGISLNAGYRYDDVRMCVASPAGAKGGMVAEASVLLKWDHEDVSIGAKIPFFRPILFGIAFKLLQFEPEFFATIPVGNDKNWVLTPGAGVTVHYGPAYTADQHNRGEEFWALGPKLTFTVARSIGEKGNKYVGLRTFFTPLMGWGEGSVDGIVAGAAIDFSVYRR